MSVICSFRNPLTGCRFNLLHCKLNGLPAPELIWISPDGSLQLSQTSNTPPPFPAARRTYLIILSENERRQEVPPHGRRLEEEEEDAKVLVDDVRAAVSLLGGLSVPGDGQVRALGRPQGSAAQPQDDRGGHESVPECETVTAVTLL